MSKTTLIEAGKENLVTRAMFNVSAQETEHVHVA